VEGLILDPNGNKCVRKCDLGFTAQLNEETKQLTCVGASVVLDANGEAINNKLETALNLESRSPRSLRGFVSQNVLQRTRILVKNTAKEGVKITHTLKLAALYLIGKGDEKQQVPEEKLEKAKVETQAEIDKTIANRV
jgi:hypothetical protein